MNTEIRMLKKIRTASGLNQSDLARATGLSRAAISLLEKGEREPSLNTALMISKVLNVSVYALIGETEYPNNEFTARAEITKLQQALSKILTLASEKVDW